MNPILQRLFLSTVIAVLTIVNFCMPGPVYAVPGGGQIVGATSLNYDYDRKQFYATGWACQQGLHTSIAIHVYVDRSAYDRPSGIRVAMGTADMGSEPAVNQACQDRDGKHRFKIYLPADVFANNQERKLYVHGIRPAGNGENSALPGSGILQQPARWTRTSGPFRPVSGSYASSATHPRVFSTTKDLEDMARRIEIPNSYSSKRFGQLSTQIARDLVSPNDWSATYTGCDAGIYQYSFSYEPQDGNAAKVHTALNVNSSSVAPAGAAVIASRLALYAALIKAGAKPLAGGPSPDKASALAKKILLAWSEHGFRNERGVIRTTLSEFCDDQGKPVQSGVGLQVSRGIVYSVQTQDLLMYLGALNATEVKEANEFHGAMYDLIRNALNSEFSLQVALCDHYNNQSANSVAGLLALARLLDNQKQFEAALNGGEPSIRVSLPWNALLNGAIYGKGDAPNVCRPNTGPDSLSSKPFFETPTVAPGEIDDRFRNLHPQQGIGYPMFTLERFFDSAEILRNAGFDGYGYRGVHQQSIEMAISYYACYARGAGFGQVVTAENASSCPDSAQYYGKIVNGVDPLVMLGAYRFPNNVSLTGLEQEAKSAATMGAFTLDAILFGKWRD